MKEKKVYTTTDQQSAAIEAARKKASFGRIIRVQEELKKMNLPVYLDLLYEHLDKGGDGLYKAYTERFAREQYLDFSDVRVRNELFNKFSILHDPYHRYTFEKKFLTLHEDGTFSLNEKAIDEHYTEMYSYTITQDEQDAIDAICKALDTLHLTPETARKYFGRDTDGKIVPTGQRIYAVLSGGPLPAL